MPACSFHCPRFLRFRRSRSLNPSPGGPHDNTAVSSSSNQSRSVQAYRPLVPPHLPHTHSPSSLQSFNPQPLTPSSSQNLPHRQHQNQCIFNQAHHFSVVGSPFVDGNNANITVKNIFSTTPNQFMKELLEETIPGAAFDSSARDPPARCHPGTRLAILERCQYFIANCNGEKKMRWIVGAAGVGKSAIMQNVVESPNLPVTFHASIFFSINGRNDGTKAIITLSYQLAAKSEPYRQFIEYEITRDPSLGQASVSVHFKKFIVEPFMHHPRLISVGRILIIIDGLDECNRPRSQLEILQLISDFCIMHPSSPIVWLIASRPEQHTVSFFSSPNVLPTYEKEEIPVDSNEARADVERFLRGELKGIREASDSLDPQWPEEREFWKLTDASGGLFAFAHTIVRYIGDLNVGNPVSQLADVLNIIDNHPITGMPREEHPMALLDALYARIMSNVPPKIMLYTQNILLALASDWDLSLWTRGRTNFVVLCNWLGMTCDEAYAAINHLRSVLYVPRRDKAHEEKLEPFHKSFIDYISDFTRSCFSPDIQLEAQQLKTECAFRILQEAPDGIDFGDVDYKLWHGALMRGPGTGDKVSLTWLVGERVGWNDDETRLNLYKLAIGEVVAGMERGDPTFQSKFCIRLLTTRFREYYGNFPRHALRDLLFDENRRYEFMMHGLLKETPLQAVNISTMPNAIKLQFRRPARTGKNSSDPWNSLCEHVRTGQWEIGKNQDWKTSFRWYGPLECAFCSERFKNQLENRKIRSPDHTLVILFTAARNCCVEFQIGRTFKVWEHCIKYDLYQSAGFGGLSKGYCTQRHERLNRTGLLVVSSVRKVAIVPDNQDTLGIFGGSFLM